MESRVESVQANVWMRTLVSALAGSLVIALFAQISFTLWFTPVPFAMQNFGVFLVASLLGPRAGVAAVVLYLAQGASGLPVFAMHKAGMNVLFGYTGGYLLSYIPVAYVIGTFAQLESHFIKRLGAFCAGWAINIVIGTLWLAVCSGSFTAAWLGGAYPFLLAGACKVVALVALPNLGPKMHRWLSLETHS